LVYLKDAFGNSVSAPTLSFNGTYAASISVFASPINVCPQIQNQIVFAPVSNNSEFITY